MLKSERLHFFKVAYNPGNGIVNIHISIIKPVISFIYIHFGTSAVRRFTVDSQ